MQNTALDKTLASKSLLSSLNITKLLSGDDVTEVAINRPNEMWVKEKGFWRRCDNPKITHSSFKQLVNALAVLNGGSIGVKNPIASVTLPDGERGWIVTPPACASFNCSLTIRKPSPVRFSLKDYKKSGRFDRVFESPSVPNDILPFEKEIKKAIKDRDIEKVCRLCVDNKLNVLCGGETGSGKTTFMKAFVDLYPENKRYITVEDSLELDLPNHKNNVRLLYSSVEGGVTAKKLIESCMRMNPDHVFLTELKGDEAWNYILLLSTGHEGSITSSHFSNARSGHRRVADLIKQSPIGVTLDYNMILETVRKTIDIVFFWKDTYLEEVYYNPEGKINIMKGENYE